MERFRACFGDLVDPRTGNAQRHDLGELLLIALAATLCGAESCVDMALFGRAKEPFLRRFLRLEGGVPSHDTFSRLFRLLDPDRFEASFGRFVAAFAAPRNEVVAVDGKTTTASRYYLLSKPLAAARLAQVVRSHWHIENRLHWVLDVVMDEDGSRARKDYGPENLARLRRFALNLLRVNPDPGSTRGKIKRAGWDDAFLFQILSAA